MMWNFADWACSFGALIPFLQIAFGVNTLSSVWDGIYDSLSKTQQESQTSDNRLLALVEADSVTRKRVEDQRKECGARMNRLRKSGRIFGGVSAAVIALALLLVASETRVEGWLLIPVLLFSLGIPFLMLTMYVMGRRCDKNVTRMAVSIVQEIAKRREETLNLEERPDYKEVVSE